LQPGCRFYDASHIYIGKNVKIGANVSLASVMHDINNSHLILAKTVVICDNVWIGENAMIRCGVTIGENARIGMGAIVTKDVPANATVTGVNQLQSRTCVSCGTSKLNRDAVKCKICANKDKQIKVSIEGIVYDSYLDAESKLGIKRLTIRKRVLSHTEQFKDWKLC
jgi:tetrahydrodipicolinate N-succinyltransferase